MNFTEWRAISTFVKRNCWPIAIVALVAVSPILAVVAGPYLTAIVLTKFTDSGLGSAREVGTFGGSFGLASAVFSSLAAGGAVVAVFLQRKELELQRGDMAKQVEKLQSQVDATQQLAAGLKALAMSQRAATIEQTEESKKSRKQELEIHNSKRSSTRLEIAINNLVSHRKVLLDSEELLFSYLETWKHQSTHFKRGVEYRHQYDRWISTIKSIALQNAGVNIFKSELMRRSPSYVRAVEKHENIEVVLKEDLEFGFQPGQIDLDLLKKVRGQVRAGNPSALELVKPTQS